MDDSSVDLDHLTITGKHRALTHLDVEVKEDTIVIVTQAFGPHGDNLVGLRGVKFDGYDAITVLVRAAGRDEEVHLSPIHGDARKKGFDDLPMGTRCELLCPVCKAPLDLVGEVEDASGGSYYAIYLTPKLSKGSMAAVSNVWGHYHSRVIDEFELISQWTAEEDGVPT